MSGSDETNVGFRLCQYLDGWLGRRDRLELEAQLERDEALREELRHYAALEEYLADVGRREIDGVDYDLQRREIVAAVERRALLRPARRRRVLLRPLFAATAAAAMVLVAVSLGIYLHAGRPAGPAVSVQWLPSAPRPSGTVEVSMTIAPPSFDELPLAPDAGPAAAAPAGTVVVSVGSAVAAPMPAEPMVVF